MKKFWPVLLLAFQYWRTRDDKGHRGPMTKEVKEGTGCGCGCLMLILLLIIAAIIGTREGAVITTSDAGAPVEIGALAVE